MDDGRTRDIIVIGASLGGVEALTTLARALPPELPAAVLVVQHTSAESPGLLSGILDRSGPLGATMARDGMQPEHGCIYVAPPDRHLLLAADGIRVAFGPRENRSRPAIDPLFRSAAVHHRSRVIGVILTGLLSDGAAGLVAVHRCGGIAIVQEPDDAAHAGMPAAALAAVGEARTATLAALPQLLLQLVREPMPPPPPVPEGLRIEVELSLRTMRSDDWTRVPGHATDFTCPECHGALREIDNGGVRRFRCRVGHAFSLDALLDATDNAVEEALWIALQTLDERKQMLETMIAEERARGRPRSAAGLEERAQEAGRHAERLRALIQRISA